MVEDALAELREEPDNPPIAIGNWGADDALVHNNNPSRWENEWVGNIEYTRWQGGGEGERLWLACMNDSFTVDYVEIAAQESEGETIDDRETWTEVSEHDEFDDALDAFIEELRQRIEE